ncbi:MAG: hypothetical protein NVSMB52_15280 [Chloroflexota bacterium]
MKLKFRLIFAAFTLSAALYPGHLASAQAAIPVIVSLQHSHRIFATYREIELSLELRASFDNPFDPAQVDLSAIFTAPSGYSFHVNGFYYQAYSLVSQSNGQKELTPQGRPFWRIRFAASESGKWRYRVILRDSTGMSASSSMGSPIQVAQRKDAGYVRISKKDHRYLAFDNGDNYFPVGENLAWGHSVLAVNNYDDWINGPGKLRDQGVNFIRIWMAPWSFSLDTSTPIGNYSDRMAQAWGFDQVLDMANRTNIRVLLTLQQHAAFVANRWSSNPYNAANGGPAQQPCGFFTDTLAVLMFSRNIRYIVARWGYSSAILAWELFNEVDLVPGYSTCRNAAFQWHVLMIRTLRSLDPYHHLVTTSFSSISGDPSIWRLPGISIVQGHSYRYGHATSFGHDISILRKYNKPVWLGEFGTPNYPNDYTTDTRGRYIHDGQWTSLLAGAAGSGFPWFWDTYVDKYNAYSVFAAEIHFLTGLHLDRYSFQPDQRRDEPLTHDITARILALQGRRLSLIWVYLEPHSSSGVPRNTWAPLRVTIPGLTVGCVHWWDTISGVPIRSVTVWAHHNLVATPFPGSRPDYAAKVTFGNCKKSDFRLR